MIKSEKLYQMLHGGAFQPFRIHMKDGRHYNVVNKHAAVIGETYMSIGTVSANQRDVEWPVCEHTDHVDLADIMRLEMLDN